MDHVPRVILARKRQGFSYIPTLLHIADYPAPQFTLFFQKADVTDAVETFLGSGQCDTNSVFRLKETDFAFFVAANERQQNNFVLFALEIVHCTDSHSAEEIFGHFFLELD